MILCLHMSRNTDKIGASLCAFRCGRTAQYERLGYPMENPPICTICPRRCGAVRTQDSGSGFCGMPSNPVIARAALHTGEEPCISGTAGSGAIFFSGCSLRCLYCQNHTISHDRFGERITPTHLAEIFRELESEGAHNINLVNPTHFVPAILSALEIYRPSLPIVYNTSGYERVETLHMLDGAVDIYLPDLKYVDSDLSARFSHAGDYFDFASQAILEMARQTGPIQLDENGIARRGTMVRHLLLPGHTKSSIAVLDWLAAHLPKGVLVSLMFQYTPIDPTLPYPELNRRATVRECEKVWNHLIELDLTDGYVQDRRSASKAFIPAFDLTGVHGHPL